LTESELISIDKSVSFTGGCQNKIGFVRTSSCNYDDISEIEGYSLNCHMWNCPACAKVLKNQLLDRIHLGLKDKSDFYFFTVTSSYRDMDIKFSWARMRTTLYNNNFYPDRFVWVMELTPPSHSYTDWKGAKRISVGGLRHFHGLISFVDKIPSKEEFGAFWERATKYEANQVHFEKLWDIKSPAGYMSKYVTKALYSGYKDRERRIGFSQNFPKLENNLEKKSGVYLPYDPRVELPEDKEFTKMIENMNKKRYL
jgi:hypothetical protein